MKNLISGLLLLDEKGSKLVYSEHDIIYAGYTDAELSEKESNLLKSLGWHWEEELQCWAIFT